jgi:hypothetical protein
MPNKQESERKKYNENGNLFVSTTREKYIYAINDSNCKTLRIVDDFNDSLNILCLLHITNFIHNNFDLGNEDK